MASGSAKVTLVDSKTKRQSLVRLAAPGDLLGYRCIFSVDKFRGTAAALTPTVACKISKKFVFSLIAKAPLFSFELLNRMGRELAAAEDHHHSFCQKNVRERLAEALLILKDKFGVDSPDGWKINTRLTRSELSNWVGASRETVIRELTHFTLEGLIESAGDFTFIKNLGALAVIGDTGSQADLPVHHRPVVLGVVGDQQNRGLRDAPNFLEVKDQVPPQI